MSKRKQDGYVVMNLRVPTTVADWITEIADKGLLGGSVDSVVTHILQQHLFDVALREASVKVKAQRK